MPNQFEVMTDCNLFCGAVADRSPNYGNNLALTELKLPAWEERYVDFRPGGGNVAIEVDVQFVRLQASFTIAGITPQIMKILRPVSGMATHFEAYGVLRDMQTFVPRQAVAVMTGRLGRVEPSNFRREEVLHHTYAIRGLTSYRLLVAGFNQDTGVEEIDIIYDWDFMTNKLLIGGV